MSKTSSGGQGPQRRRRRRWVVVLLVLVAAAGGYGWYARPWEPKVEQVAAEVLSPSSVSQVLAVNGRVAAGRQVTVRAAVAAQVLRIGADEGDAVAAGDMLVTLDPAVIEAQVEQARAALEAQQARQLQAQTALERARALGENTTRSSREDAELALAASEKQTAGLEAALAEVERQAENYVIRAPIGGVVLSRDVDVGQLVDPQSALFVVADTSDLIVETDVDELYSARVMPGLKALYPSTPQDAFNALLAAYEDNNPVILFEHKALYRRGKHSLAWNPAYRDVWSPRLVRAGAHATLVTYGEMVHLATEAAAYLESEYEKSVEVWDLRALAPLRLDTIEASLQRTGRLIVLHEGRRTHGFGAELVARLTEKHFSSLKAAPLRIASLDLPVPFAPELEHAFRPTKDKIIERITEWMG